MAYKFTVGAKVLCVNENGPVGHPAARPNSEIKRGEIYTICEVVPGEAFADGEPAITLEEIVGPTISGLYPAFWMSQFEPLEPSA